MKSKVISAIIAIILMIVIFNVGGIVFNLSVLTLALLGFREYINVRCKSNDISDFIKFIAYLSMAFFIIGISKPVGTLFTVDYRIVSGLVLLLLVPTIFYHDKDRYSVNDAFYLIGGIFFLGSSFRLMIMYRTIDLKLIYYLFSVPIIADTFALFTGMLIGKTKLLESISPKKTIEGMIGGVLAASIFSSCLYMTFFPEKYSLIVVVIITMFLAIISELGDLVFSAIKRHYGVKDFSNIIPGHGGILDRFDSIIFVMLVYLFFI